MKEINEQTNWWVQANEQNYDVINEWFKKRTGCIAQKDGKIGIYLDHNSRLIHGNITKNDLPKKDGCYDFGKEISFKDFKKYILKLKGDVFPENWCIKITNSNNSYLNEKRVHGCTDYGFLNYHLNDSIVNFWNWSADFPKGCIEITLDDFKKHVILEPTTKGYPTSLETVKFKSEPDKCVGKQPNLAFMGNEDFSIKNDIVERYEKLKREEFYILDSRTQHEVDQKMSKYWETYNISKDILDKNRVILDCSDRESRFKPDKGSMFLYGTGGEMDTNQAEKEFKWAELPDYMLKQRTTYDVLKLYPLTPKECFKAPSDIIYVKKLKTFLK